MLTQMPTAKVKPTMNKQILIIDSRVNEYQQLLAGVHPNFEIAILDDNQDGILQITNVLRAYQSADEQHTFSVHLIAHGNPGCLYLGSSHLSLDTLGHYSTHIRSWFSSPRSELLIYGCNVAAGDAGEEFINKLHQLTTVSIAASSTLVGHTTLGGNWDLDTQIGKVQSQIAFDAETTSQYQHVLAVRVAVAGLTSGDESGLQSIVSQLNNDTYFDFTAVLVTPDGLDSAAELNNYDVVVIGNGGDSAANDGFSVFGSALASWVQAGGGLVSAGWTVFGSIASNANEVALDAVIPVTTTGIGTDYGVLTGSDTINITNASHPVTQGVSNFATGANEAAEYPFTVNAEGTVLATSSGYPTVVIGEYGSGRSVYLSPSYSTSGNSSLRTGEADQLLEQAVAWASNQTLVDSPDETFESGDFSQLPWEFGGNTAWTISTNASNGSYSAQSGSGLPALGTSTMFLTLNVVEAGTLSFDWSVSSENNGDFLKFYIDGVLKGSISGSQSYQTFSTSVSAGEHTFTWSYEKNGSVNTGQDKGFVDNIFLPPVDLNNAPVFTSSTSVSVEENTTLAVDVNATDVDGNPIVYAISSGTGSTNEDAALFSIDPSTGELSFNTPPNYEAPADVGGNNVYQVEVIADDGVGGISTQALSITVTDVDESSSGTNSNYITDFNNDNLPDIVWRNGSQGRTSIWYTDGQTKLSQGATSHSPSSPNWVTVGVGDYDQDGERDDILWHNQSTNSNVVWFMNGRDRVGRVRLDNSQPNSNWEVEGVGDFDHSGYADDILWRNTATGKTVVWLMDGTTKKPGRVDFGVINPVWQAHGVGDFDDNGYLDDIVLRNSQNSTIKIWTNDGATRNGSYKLENSLSTTAWRIEGVGDFDGDGVVNDLFWYNSSKELARSWSIENGVKVSTSSLNAVPPGSGWDAVI